MENFQRISPWGRVELQANGRRKIRPCLIQVNKYSILMRKYEVSAGNSKAVSKLRFDMNIIIYKSKR